MRLATSAFRPGKMHSPGTVRAERVVVVAAFEPELQKFREVLPEVPARAVGIGLVDAAIGTRGIVAELRPDLVIAIGTCGAFSPRVRAFRMDVVVASEAVLVDVAAVTKKTAVPDAVATRVAATERFGAKRELGIVATTLGVTTDDATAAAIVKATKARAEHMEAFAIARACESAGVRCGIVLGVANEVGANGRAEWRNNHVEASARAATFVAAWLGPRVEKKLKRSTTPRTRA